MIFLELLSMVIAVVLFILLLTQVIMPFLFGTPFFSLFRKDSPLKEQVKTVEKELAEKTELVMLEEQLSIVQEQLDEINRRKAELEGKV